MDPDNQWIATTRGGSAGLAASGYAWGAFDGPRLVAVACTFFLGSRHEELGVATEPEYRGRRLSPACVRPLCADIVKRGHIPTWTASHDNAASRRVAEKTGFQVVGTDVLYGVGVDLPAVTPQAS
jgi:predicted GNAT family acetyltransferase